MVVLDGLDAVIGAVGRHLGYTEWMTVGEDRFARFAEATGDAHHEYLALSLSNYFLPQIVDVRGVSAGVNYGTESVRFPAPLAPGAQLRAGAELVRAEAVSGGVQTMMRITLESTGGPVCVIESLSRWLA